MKAKLQFDLSNSEGYIEFQRCIYADEMHSALFKLRNNSKKQFLGKIHSGLSPEDAWDKVIEDVFCHLTVDLDDLI